MKVVAEVALESGKKGAKKGAKELAEGSATEGTTTTVVAEASKAGCQAAATQAIQTGTRHATGAAIANATINTACKEGGRRGAVQVANTAGVNAARGGFAAAGGAGVAVSGVATFGVGISSAVGQKGAEKLSDNLGIDDGEQVKHGRHAMGAGGAVAAGAVAGACVGGPVGAAAGAGVGVVSYAVGESIDALFKCGMGPSGNCVQIKMGKVPNGWGVNVYSYNNNDSWHVKSYDHKWVTAEEWISAGQKVEEDFCIVIYDGNGHQKCLTGDHLCKAGDCLLVEYGPEHGHKWCITHYRDGKKWYDRKSES